MPCCAHLTHNTIKEGLKFSPDLDNLVKRISKDISSKAKSSIKLAEELRKLDKRCQKSIVTRCVFKLNHFFFDK